MRYLNLDQIWAETRTTVDPSDFEDLWAGVLERVENPEPRVNRTWPRRALAVAGLAMAAAVLVACLSTLPSRNSTAPVMAKAEVIPVEQGEVLFIRIADGQTKLEHEPMSVATEVATEDLSPDLDIWNKAGAIP